MTTASASADIGVLYRFCAQSMNYPEPSWFNEDYLSALYNLLEILDAGLEKEQLQAAISASDDVIEALQIEYTRLFINGVPHVVAPPYGSVYIDKSLLGLHAEKVNRFYTEHGYMLKPGSELPDHIVNQLEFLAILADKNDHQSEAEFLRHMFLTWFPKFRARVLDETLHPFYSTIVQFIDYLTKEDDEHGIQLDEA